MSKLLRRAKVKLDAAKCSRNKAGHDDAYLDDACFQIQQCIEFTIKYFIELRGGIYVRTHELRPNLMRLRQLGIDMPVLDLLYNEAPNLDRWETESRYKDDFCAVAQDFDRYAELADELITYVDALVIEPAEPLNDAYDLIPDSFKVLFNSKEDCMRAWNVAHPELSRPD